MQSLLVLHNGEDIRESSDHRTVGKETDLCQLLECMIAVFLNKQVSKQYKNTPLQQSVSTWIWFAK